MSGGKISSFRAPVLVTHPTQLNHRGNEDVLSIGLFMVTKCKQLNPNPRGMGLWEQLSSFSTPDNTGYLNVTLSKKRSFKRVEEQDIS